MVITIFKYSTNSNINLYRYNTCRVVLFVDNETGLIVSTLILISVIGHGMTDELGRSEL